MKIGDFVTVKRDPLDGRPSETWTGTVEYLNDSGGFGITWGSGGRYFPHDSQAKKLDNVKQVTKIG